MKYSFIPLIMLLAVQSMAADPKPTTASKAVAVTPKPIKTEIQQDAKASLLKHGVKEIIFSTRKNSNDGHWYANLGYWSYDENKMLYGKNGRLCKLNIETGEMTVLIDDPEGTVRDPTVHYDAKKILFSWRKADSRIFHLYECDLNGKNIKQITDGDYDDIEPCCLPDGGIIFVSTRAKRYVNCWLTQVATVHRCDGDPSAEELRAGGKNVLELSANIEHDNTPWVLPDGRIIYMRWEYVDRSQVDYHHLWTMNPDGTGQTIYFGNMHPPGLYIDAKPIPGSDEVLFINSPGHGGIEHKGSVAIVSDKKGPDDMSALRNIARGSYRDPWPLSKDLFIVARNRSIVTMDSTGKTAKFYELPEEYGAAKIQEPRPVIKRKRERVIPSKINLAKSTGQLILNDVYFGRNMKGVKRGEIKKLLVLETLPKPINFTGGMDPLTYGGSFTMERVFGTVPVEKDGSAYMELPANRAFFFVALDENDNSVKRMQSFLSVRPGEVQSCVGCHEERGTTPENREVKRLMALKRKPSKPEKIKGIPEVFDFPRDIQPILDKHCVKCHNYKDRKGGISLTGDRGPMFSHSYVTLTLKKQVADGRNLAKSNYPPRALGTSASPLMKKIDGSHPSAPGHKVKLSKHEENMIRYWIESAACYPGTYASLGHGSIGGYQQNKQIKKDTSLPTAKLMREAIGKRCIKCHTQKSKTPVPGSLIAEMGISFWRYDVDDPRLKLSRHLVFNLSRPEKSMMLLAPLSKEAGGLGLCKEKLTAENGTPDAKAMGDKKLKAGDKDGSRRDAEGAEKSAEVFASTDDEDYKIILAHIAAGKDMLENKVTRFDMKNFKPRIEYFREMKRYGILPNSFDPEKDKFDVYDIDQKYWESLWYYPKGAKRPKLYDNKPATTTDVKSDDKSVAVGEPCGSFPYSLITADVDSYEVVIHGKDGSREWVYDAVRSIDVWQLKNDEVLIAYLPSKKTGDKGGVRIVNKEKKIIFDHQVDDEVMSCCPLPNGNILFTECAKGVLTEITRKGEVKRQISLKAKGKGHKTVRFMRLTPQNTVLAAECYSHIVREYDWDSKVINEFSLKMAYHASRLKNGNTLVSGYKPARVVEFDKKGKAVWELDIKKLQTQGVNFGRRTQFCEVTRLENGNTLLVNCNRSNEIGDSVVLEVSSDMKLLHQWKATKTTKGITAAKPL